MKIKYYILLLTITLFNYSSAQTNLSNRQEYLTIKSIFPTSAFEKEAKFGIGVQKKYKRIGLELEYSRIWFLWAFWEEAAFGDNLFHAKTNGNRIRINLKYYLFELSNNINSEFGGYLSIMPSYSKVRYNMSYWRFDSTAVSSNSRYTDSSFIPVKYNSTNFNVNILLGNEFSLNHRLNIDYYTGLGIKFYRINLPNDTPEYFQPYSKPNKSGNYLNLIMGLKVGYILNFKYFKKKR